MPESYSVQAILSAQDKGFAAAFKNALSSTDSLAGKLKSGLGFGIMQAAGAKAFNTLTAGISGFSGGIVKNGMEFESTMSEVAAISGATGKDLDALTDAAKKMGATTAFTSTEAAEALKYMGMAGWDASQMTAALPDVMNLAAASGEGLATVSDIVTDGLTAFGLGAEDASRFSDALAAAATSTNTNVGMMGETFKYVGPVCGTLGASMEDAAVASGLMANAGIKSSQAGTAMRRGLQNLIDPTDKQAAAMEKYGIAIQKNEDGSVDLMGTMKNLRSSLGGLNETEQAAALSSIFGANAMSGWAAICNASEADFTKVTDAIYNCDGAAKEMADIKLDNLQGDIALFQSALSGIQQTIYDKVNPSLRSIVQVGTKALSGINDILSGNGITLDGSAFSQFMYDANKYISILPDIFDGVGTAIGDAVGAIGDSLGKLNGKFGSHKSVMNFRSALEGVADSIKKAAGFIESHSDQIAWLITQLPKLAAAFVGFKILKTLTGPLFSFGKGIASIASAVGGGLAGKLMKTGEAGKFMSDTTVSSSGKMLEAGKAFALMGVGVLLVAAGFALLAQSSIALANAGPAAIAVMAGMVVAVAAIGAGMVIALKALAPMSASLVPAAAAMLLMGAAVLVAAAGFALLANSAIKLANSGGVAIAVMGGLVAALAGLMVLAAALGPALTAGAIGLLAFGAAMLMVGAGARLAAPLVEALPPVITALGDAMSQLVPIIADAVTQITTAIGDTFCKAFETAAQSISTVLETLSTGISTVVTSIGEAISGVLDSVAGIITSVGEAAKNAGIGFYLLAEGVRNLTELNLLDMGTSLAAVATGIGSIAVASAGLAAAGEGMKNLGIGLVLIQTYAVTAVAALKGIPAALTPLTTVVPTIVPAFVMLSTAVQNFATTALAAFSSVAGGTAVVIASFNSVGTAVMALAVYAGAAGGGISSLAGALAKTANGANTLAGGANAAKSALSGLTGATNTVQAGISRLGAVAVQAMNQLTNAFRRAAAQATVSGRQIGNNLLNGVKSGLNKLPGAATAAMSRFTSAVRSGGARAVSVARSAASSIVSALRSASSGAHSAGVAIGSGLASGMSSQLGRVRSIAAQLAAAANAAIRAKAQIHSPSRVTRKSGAQMGEGLAIGLRSKSNAVLSAASSLAGKAMKALSRGTTAKGGKYKKMAEKLGKTYKSNLSKALKKNLKSVKKLIGNILLGKSVKGITKTVRKKGKKAVKSLKLTKQGKNLSKELYSAYKDAVKKASDKAVTATQKSLTRIGEKYQEKYDAIIQKRKAFYERLSDVGDLYKADDYGYIALKDFKSAAKQIKQYSSNIEKLKQILPDGLMEEILGLDTASGLQLTNYLLGMSTKKIEQWGKEYSAMMKAAKKASNTYYQPQLDAVKQAFDHAVVKEMQKLDRKLDTIGQNAIQGFINGMNKKLKSLKGNSKKMAKAVVGVMKSQLSIHSPSRVMATIGQFTGQGFINGLDRMASKAEAAMANLVTLPDVQVPDVRIPALAGGPGGSEDDYHLPVSTGEITIVVPVMMEGREIARVTAKYDAEEQAKLQRREDRRRGRA